MQNSNATQKTPKPWPVVEIGYAHIDNLNFDEAIAAILALREKNRPSYVVTPNADHIVNLEDDIEFQAVYEKASLQFADGMPLVWGSKVLGTPIKERVAGSDLMPALCAKAAELGLSVFLLGAPPGVADIAAQKLVEKHPNIKIAGTYSPPFGFEKNDDENDKIIDMLNAAKADLVFIGLGSPKQEKWIYRHRKRLDKGVFVCIGATISFIAGVEKRAPVLMQKTGTEWLFRLLQDPKRLAKRYAKDTMIAWVLAKTWQKERFPSQK